MCHGNDHMKVCRDISVDIVLSLLEVAGCERDNGEKINSRK